jgi:hypothetical protein
MLGRSRIPYPCRWKVDLIRRIPSRIGGRIVDDCEHLVLHRDVPANIAISLSRQEQTLGRGSEEGIGSKREYLIGLGGVRVPNNLVQGDLVRIYWGTPPNLSSIPQVPVGYGDILIFEVGGNQVYLNWGTNGWANSEYSLIFDEVWELFSGSTKIAEFSDNPNDPQLTCRPFPEGISLRKISGTPLDFQVLSVDHKYDDFAMWHHTSLIVDYMDMDGRKRL